MLRDWLAGDVAPAAVKAKLAEWLEGRACATGTFPATRPTSVSRIPMRQKVLYVWLDAPIGYLASFRAFCDATGTDFDAFLRDAQHGRMHHFIGKDIINSTAVWPAMLHGAGYAPRAGCT
jgi:methionyl-tRNA synthetase